MAEHCHFSGHNIETLMSAKLLHPTLKCSRLNTLEEIETIIAKNKFADHLLNDLDAVFFHSLVRCY